MKIILASGSNGRKTILESLKIPFEVVESKIDEEKIVDRYPVKVATLRASAKAEEVGKRSHCLTENVLVIGADTVGFMGGWVFGKPKNRREAEEILRRLSGRTHKYVSAHCIINFQIPASWQGGQSSKFQDPKIPRNQRLGSSTVQQFNRSCGYDISSVTFRKLTSADIKTYLDRVEYKKLCGGIKINDSPQDFVTSINGSISNIIGLSLEKIIPFLRKEGIIK